MHAMADDMRPQLRCGDTLVARQACFPMSEAPAPSSSRLLFLDWLRIAAFGLLVPYHVGMYYVSWSFHVKSPHASPALEPWMMLSSPWRMSLIFFIAGIASAFMMREKTDGAMLRQRSRRLLLPLLIGMLVVIPPQTYIEVVFKYHYSGSFLDFLKLYYSGYHGFCEGSRCLDMPTWNHLWFLPYLWSYTAVLWLWMRLDPKGLDRLSHRLGLRAWVCLPWVLLLVFRLALEKRFPQSYDWIHDLYSHAQFLCIFLLGACFAQRAEMWAWIGARRRISLVLALCSWAVFLLSYRQVPGWLSQALLASQQWCALLAAIGFAHQYWNRDHRWRAVLTEAVFPFYIFHQTWIIVLTQVMRPLDVPPWLEGPALILLTFLLSALSYLLARRLGYFRLWFGMARAPFGKTTAPPQAGTG